MQATGPRQLLSVRAFFAHAHSICQMHAVSLATHCLPSTLRLQVFGDAPSQLLKNELAPGAAEGYVEEQQNQLLLLIYCFTVTVMFS
jgi:hypothetical protein